MNAGLTSTRHLRFGYLALWVTAAAVIAAALYRYTQQPSFWLDEAFIAASLRRPSLNTIFARLEYGQYFPRVYLYLIALLRGIFGYQIWDLRLFPFLSFITATALWTRLLAKRAGLDAAVSLLAASLLLGSIFWLDQSIMLKQYTFDVLVALIPFLVGDDFFEHSLVKGEKRALLSLLALPCLVSYSYPFALGARLTGWYLCQGRRASWRINLPSVLILGSTLVLALAAMWATDHRFNLIDRPAKLAYWDDCILRSALQRNAGSALKLVGGFLWGWHGRQPFVTAGMVPLQALGVYSAVSRWKNSAPDEPGCTWGSRSIGSIVLLLAMIAASALLAYPICAGRAVLFVQVHTQILALEGALFVMRRWSARRAVAVVFYSFIAVVTFHSGRDYIRFIRSEPSENIRSMLPMVAAVNATTLWVHSCSIVQVQTLPDPLPVSEVVLGTDRKPEPGEKVLILWTHLGSRRCREELELVRRNARKWQIIHEGPGRGLALAEF